MTKLEQDLVKVKTVPYKINRIAYTAISNALYESTLELQPTVYENYVFLVVEPRTIFLYRWWQRLRAPHGCILE